MRHAHHERPAAQLVAQPGVRIERDRQQRRRRDRAGRRWRRPERPGRARPRGQPRPGRVVRHAVLDPVARRLRGDADQAVRRQVGLHEQPIVLVHPEVRREPVGEAARHRFAVVARRVDEPAHRDAHHVAGALQRQLRVQARGERLAEPVEGAALAGTEGHRLRRLEPRLGRGRLRRDDRRALRRHHRVAPARPALRAEVERTRAGGAVQRLEHARRGLLPGLERVRRLGERRPGARGGVVERVDARDSAGRTTWRWSAEIRPSSASTRS